MQMFVGAGKIPPKTLCLKLVLEKMWGHIFALWHGHSLLLPYMPSRSSTHFLACPKNLKQKRVHRPSFQNSHCLDCEV